MTRKLLILSLLMLTYPAIAQIVSSPITPRSTRPTVPVVPMQWTVQAYAVDGALAAPTFETGDAPTARAKAAAYCGLIGADAATIARIQIMTFRPLADEHDAVYFPCDVATNAARGRVSYVRVVVQKATAD